MNNEDRELIAKPEIKNESADYVVAAAKSVLGAIPFVGSLLSELAGGIIPNQRIDRLSRFATELESRFASLDQEFVRSKLTDENFTDLFEESARQAARGVTNERLKYIAAILANGVDPSKVSYIESKHLLRILGDLNDVEVIWLRFHANMVMGSDVEFREKHKEILNRPLPRMGSDQATIDKAAIHDSYMIHMAQLGLLTPRFETDLKMRSPKFDSNTGAMKVRGYQITSLGKFLLRQIDFDGEAESPVSE